MYCLRRGELGVLEKSLWIPTLYSILLKLDGAGHIYHWDNKENSLTLHVNCWPHVFNQHNKSIFLDKTVSRLGHFTITMIWSINVNNVYHQFVNLTMGNLSCEYMICFHCYLKLHVEQILVSKWKYWWWTGHSSSAASSAGEGEIQVLERIGQ